jgi:RHS repeat-associated protein
MKTVLFVCFMAVLVPQVRAATGWCLSGPTCYSSPLNMCRAWVNEIGPIDVDRFACITADNGDGSYNCRQHYYPIEGSCETGASFFQTLYPTTVAQNCPRPASDIITYAYDNAGQLSRATLPDGGFLQYNYVAAQLTEISDSLGNRITYTLDAMGNRTQDQVFDAGNTLTQSRSRVFNNRNRVSQDIGAQGQTTSYGYDNNGNLTTVNAPLSGVTTYTYDASNRLLRTTDPLGQQVNYGYAGNLISSVSDPRGLTTNYGYSGNIVNQVLSPDAGTTSSAYDAAGNLLTQTDAKGQQTTYGYDAAGHVASITYHDGITHSYQYDDAGRITQVTEPNITSQYVYDQRGRLITETRIIAAVSYVTEYRYDMFHRLDRITYPSGRQVDYSFDAMGRVNQITTTRDGSSQTVLSDVTYQPFGPVKGWVYGNGQSYIRGFDQDGRIGSYTLGAQSFAVGYDTASRVSFVSEIGNAANTNTYAYDNLDRLTSAVTPSTTYSYSYDAAGNRLSKTVGAATTWYTPSGSSNRLASITPASGPTRNIVFDSNGSIVSDGTNQYAYDSRGRLVQAASTTYQVNWLGQRFRKGDTIFHYDHRGKLIAEGQTEYIYLGDIPVTVMSGQASPPVLSVSGAGGNVTANWSGIASPSPTDWIGVYSPGAANTAFMDWIYVSCSKTPVAALASGSCSLVIPAGSELRLLANDGYSVLAVGSAAGNTVLYIHTDHLNTPRLITNQAGQVIWRWHNTEPFGDSLPNGNITFNLRFPGQYFDAETNLHYNYFRDYDPSTGRYIEADPIGLLGGINTYVYAIDPLTQTDPFGLMGRGGAPNRPSSTAPIRFAGAGATECKCVVTPVDSRVFVLSALGGGLLGGGIVGAWGLAHVAADGAILGAAHGAAAGAVGGAVLGAAAGMVAIPILLYGGNYLVSNLFCKCEEPTCK